jgi:hypothetical protein
MGGLSAGGPFPGGVVELLCWSECPSHDQAPKMLESALAEIGSNPELVKYVWVEDDATAVERQFVGSPTFRVGGADLFPPDPGEQYGLSCRIYRRRNGRPSPLPDVEDLREALKIALLPNAFERQAN